MYGVQLLVETKMKYRSFILININWYDMIKKSMNAHPETTVYVLNLIVLFQMNQIHTHDYQIEICSVVINQVTKRIDPGNFKIYKLIPICTTMRSFPRLRESRARQF